MTIILIITSVVLFLTCTAYFVYEYITFRKTLVDQTAILGEMCAANSTAALAFRNVADAEEVLSTLKVDPNIVWAALFDEHDSLFATYSKGSLIERNRIGTFKEGFYFSDAGLEGFVAVTNNDKRLGTLYMLSATDAIYARIRLYGMIAVGVITLSLLVAYFLSRTLQRNISNPILSLAATAKAISFDKNYAIRAVPFDNDEIGALTTAFNDMLSEIEKQNRQILSFSHDLEETVKRRTQELEMAYSEMEAFSYTVSHDLNAPLRKIETFIELYLTKPGTSIDEAGQKTLEKISQNAGKMRELISDLLSFSQLGKKELDRSEVKMKEMARQIFDDFAKSEEGRNIELNLCDIPDAYVDEVTITQVWVNLISNALKYSKNNEVTRIDICSQETSAATTYYIKDNGVGFDMKDSAKLFSAFNRLHAQKDFAGTGVGLAIVHRIVTKHGGKVWAESTPNGGATFYFSIPKTPTP